MAAPKNNHGYKAEKIWRDAIHRAVKRVKTGEKDKNIEFLADALIAEALKGNVVAMKEIGDRLDGKAVQPVDGDGQGGPIKLVIERVNVD